MAKQGYPASGSRTGGHPGASGYPTAGPTFKSYPTGQSGTLPVLVSSEIDVTGLVLVLTYDQPLDAGSVPALGDFALAGTVLSALTGTPAIVGATVELDLTPAVASTETGITISYTPGVNPIQNAGGEDAAALVTQPVTNGSSHAYDPRDEGGAVFWMDMSDATSFTESAGVITAMTNKIGGGAVTPAGSPAYLATGLNSLPTADFNGTTQYFTNADAAVVAAGTSAASHTYVGVVSFDTPDRIEVIFGWANSGVVANSSRYYGETTTAFGLMVATSTSDAGANVTVSGVTTPNSLAHVYAFRADGTTVDSKIDNVSDITSTAFVPGTLTPNRAGFGARVGSTPARFLDGKISEQWVFDSSISDAALTRVYNYLKAKWGTP